MIGRRRKVPSCPACESLPLRRPHLAAQWHPDLNDRTPAEVTCGSQYRAWWQCPDKPEHVWQVAVAMRAGRQRTGCPECTLAHTSRTEIELWAELATLLDPLLGGQVSATPGPGGQQPVPASGAADRYAGRVWPHAAVLGATGGAVDMLLVLPATGPAGPARAVAVEYDSWHYHQGRQPHDDAKSARLRGLGYEVLRVREHPLPAHPGDVPVPTAPTPVETASAVLRALLERGWLDATSATVAHGYLDRGEAVGAALAAARLADRGRRDFGAESLEATHPDLVTDWDVDGNGTLTARHLRANSATQVMWICPLGDHYPAAPRDRAAGRGCPFCAGKRVNARNCVATTDPHLLPEWHPDSPVTPTAVTRGSQQQGLWRCRKPGCGHVWAASVTNRARHGSGCPACAGLATTATNNLQVCFPEVAQIWHPTRNGDLTARQVVPGSSKRAWWRCSCGKEWRGAVCDRVVAAHQACRACSRRRARRGQSRDR